MTHEVAGAVWVTTHQRVNPWSWSGEQFMGSVGAHTPKVLAAKQCADLMTQVAGAVWVPTHQRVNPWFWSGEQFMGSVGAHTPK
eukprot:5585133-Amphidinium_carterae.1